MENIRKRMRFSEMDDLMLLREVLGQNPFANIYAWEIIQENIRSLTGKNFSVRSLKDHIDLLIRLWLKENNTLISRSGIEIEVTEKAALCEEVYGLMREFTKREKRKRKVPINISRAKGINTRDKFAQQFEQTKTPLSNVSLDDEVIYFSDDYSVLDQEADAASSAVQVENNLDTDPEEEIIRIVPNTREFESGQEIFTVPNEENDAQFDIDASTSQEPLSKRVKSIARLNQAKNDKTKTDSPASKPIESLVLERRKRGRARKENVQKQGLDYLESLDKREYEMKEKELLLEERKMALEERKITLLEKQFELSSWETKKKMELHEKQLQLEIENRKSLMANIEKQNKIIEFLLEHFKKDNA